MRKISSERIHFWTRYLANDKYTKFWKYFDDDCKNCIMVFFIRYFRKKHNNFKIKADYEVLDFVLNAMLIKYPYEIFLIVYTFKPLQNHRNTK